MFDTYYTNFYNTLRDHRNDAAILNLFTETDYENAGQDLTDFWNILVRSEPDRNTGIYRALVEELFQPHILAGLAAAESDLGRNANVFQIMPSAIRDLFQQRAFASIFDNLPDDYTRFLNSHEFQGTTTQERIISFINHIGTDGFDFGEDNSIARRLYLAIAGLGLIRKADYVLKQTVHNGRNLWSLADNVLAENPGVQNELVGRLVPLVLDAWHQANLNAYNEAAQVFDNTSSDTIQADQLINYLNEVIHNSSLQKASGEDEYNIAAILANDFARRWYEQPRNINYYLQFNDINAAINKAVNRGWLQGNETWVAQLRTPESPVDVLTRASETPPVITSLTARPSPQPADTAEAPVNYQPEATITAAGTSLEPNVAEVNLDLETDQESEESGEINPTIDDYSKKLTTAYAQYAQNYFAVNPNASTESALAKAITKRPTLEEMYGPEGPDEWQWKDFLKGFGQEASLGWYKPEGAEGTDYILGRVSGGLLSMVGIAAAGGWLLKGINTLLRISPVLSKLPWYARAAVEGGEQYLAFTLIQNAASAPDRRMGFSSAGAVDFTSGEIARQTVYQSFSKLAKWTGSGGLAITAQVLGSLADYIGGAAAAAVYSKSTGQDTEDLDELVLYAGAGFLVENLIFGGIKHAKYGTLFADLKPSLDKLEGKWEQLKENPTRENLAEFYNTSEEVLGAMKAKGVEPTKVIKEVADDGIKATIDFILKQAGENVPREAIDYIVDQVNKQEAIDLIELARKVENSKVPKDPEERRQEILQEDLGEPFEPNKPEAKAPETPEKQTLDEEFANWFKKNYPKLPGVGKATYNKVLDALEHGYTKIEDIQKVKGVGRKTFEKIKKAYEEFYSQKVGEAFTLSKEQYKEVGDEVGRKVAELEKQMIYQRPREVNVGDQKFEIDVGSKEVDDIIEYIEWSKLADQIGGEPGENLRANLEFKKNRLMEDLGIKNEIDFVKLVDEIKDAYIKIQEDIKAKTENRLLTPKQIEDIKYESSNKLIEEVRTIFGKYLDSKTYERLLEFLATPKERVKALLEIGKGIPFEGDITKVKKPFNLEKYKLDEATKEILNASGQLVEQNLKKLPLQEIKKRAEKIAKELGLSQEEAEAIAALSGDLPVVFQTLRLYVADLSVQSKEAALKFLEKMQNGDPDWMDAAVNFYQILAKLQAFSGYLKKLQYNISRALSTGQLEVEPFKTAFADMDEDVQAVLSKVFKGSLTPADVQNMAALADRVAKTDTPGAVMKLASKETSWQKKISKALVQFRMMNMLSFSTIQSNFLSQAFNTIYDMFTNAFGYAFAKLGFKDPKTAAIFKARLFGMFEGLKRIFVNPIITRRKLMQAAYGLDKPPSFWQMMWLWLKNPKEYQKVMAGLDARTKTQVALIDEYMDFEALGLTPKSPILKFLVRLGDQALAYIKSFTFGGLKLGDRPFRNMYYFGGLKAAITDFKSKIPDVDWTRIEQQVLNYRAAIQVTQTLRIKGFNDKAIEEVIMRMFGENPFKYDNLELIKSLDREAIKYADYGTWQDPIESKFFKQMNDFINNNPALKFLIPFTHTPIRILEKFWNTTPFSKKLWNSLLGKYGEQAKIEALSSFVMSSILYLLGWGLYQAGILIPPAKDKKEETVLRNAGIEPASIRIGDTFISFNRFDPFPSYIFNAISALSRVANEADQELTAGKPWTDVFFEGFTNLTSMVFKSITEKTYFLTLGQILDFLRGRSPEQLTSGVLETMIPGHGLYRSVRYTDMFGVNPFKYDTLTWYRQDGRRYPRLDIFGEPIEVSPTFFGSRMMHLTDDPVEKELARLYVTTGFALPGYMNTAYGMPLNDELKYLFGQYLAMLKPKEKIAALIKSPYYQRLDDEAKGEAIYSMYMRLRNQAKYLLRRDPVFYQQYQQFKQVAEQSTKSLENVYVHLKDILDMVAGQ